MAQTFIALDLETTGLDPRADEVIEVAAVKFQGRKVLDTFTTLVRPTQPLPTYIQALTGLSPRDLEAAPAFGQVKAALAQFLGLWPIVGHRISFDLSFLEAQGLALANPTYDTRELAAILFPTLGEYSLASLGRALRLDPRAAHRALPDAHSAREVFLTLTGKIGGIDKPLLGEMAGFTRGLAWPLGALFQQALPRYIGAARGEEGLGVGFLSKEQQGRKERREGALRPRAGKPLDEEAVASLLSPGGPLARSLPGYEHRPQQVEMAQVVARAFNQGDSLLVEAGTGVGKSLAYLLPALLFSVENQVPVVVSTDTLNLQEQLKAKDIPQLQAALGVSDFRFVQLKGRSNYLCLRRWSLYTASAPPVQEIAALLRLLAWMATTSTGDRAELNLASWDMAVWGKVCALGEECLARRCQYERRGLCFLHRSRESARRAHLVVVNHALLLSDLANQAQALPPYHHLIVDEAHNLEEEATQQFGLRLSLKSISDYLERADRLALGDRRRYQGQPRPVGAILERAGDRLALFFSSLRSFVEGHALDQGGYERWLRLTQAVRAQPGWARLEVAGENLRLCLQEVEAGLSQLLAASEASEDVSYREDLEAEASALAGEGREMREHLAEIVSSPQPEMICWATLAGDTAALHAAPYHVGPLLEKSLYPSLDTLVLTGATLSTEGTFRYLRERLGIKEAQETQLDTPFDHLASTLLLLVKDIPEPDRPGYEEALAQALGEAFLASRGRALALFTSHASLRRAREALGRHVGLEARGIAVLGQGLDGPPGHLLERLKAQPGTAVLGVSSFWEGVDVAGDALSLLAIARLPFAVPTEPVTAARAELYADPFHQYTLPQAVLRFRQGFGRLIRSRRDRGVVLALDRRLLSKAYGRAFLDSLPPCNIKVVSRRDLAAEVTGWLGP